jgi:glycosyltransferase involved in cell wall biosynthesis
VLAYVRKIVATRPVTVITFEKSMPDKSLVLEVQKSGVKWIPLLFGRYGMIGGIFRVTRMWLRIDRSKIIHARGNLSGVAALLRFPRKWVWDCRSLQADQRRALSAENRITASFILMRLAEFLLAKRSNSIIVITNAVIPVLVARYKISDRKMKVISTCVDTAKFEEKPFSRTIDIKVLLAGTFSPAYDIEMINQIIAEMKRYRSVTVTVATSSGATDAWHHLHYDEVLSVSHEDMPSLIQRHDVGISIWKNDLGVCLTSVASTKTAEFLACGRPVFINSLQGDFSPLIKLHRAGIVTETSAIDEIQRYIRELFQIIDDATTPHRCRSLAQQYFDLDEGIKKILDVYSQD